MILHRGNKKPSLIPIDIFKIILPACHCTIPRSRPRILRAGHRTARLWSVWRSCRPARIKMIPRYIARHYLSSKIIVRSTRHRKDRGNCFIERLRVLSSSLKANKILPNNITIKRQKKQVLWIWVWLWYSNWNLRIEKRLPKQCMEVEYWKLRINSEIRKLVIGSQLTNNKRTHL